MEDNAYMKADRPEETFARFVWNSETKQFFGRTGASWCKIGLFYLVFYSCLAGFFAIMMTAFLQTIDNYVPKYIPGDGSSILRNPAMGFRPLPIHNIESTLIEYQVSYPDDYSRLVYALNDFIEPYEHTSSISGQHIVECSDMNYPHDGEVCRFSPTWLGDKCHKAGKWGYPDGTPCFLLKMNKMFGWEPEVYQNIEELPFNMPESLKDTIVNETSKNGGVMPRMIWVSCEGENPADKEYIGSIKYYPRNGFPAYYFPFRNQPGYMPPIVAVAFLNPMFSVMINIECRAWARNIYHDRQRRLGLVHFELLID